MEHFWHSVSKISKKLQGKFGSSVLIFLGLLIFLFGSFNYYRIRILSFNKTPDVVDLAKQNLDMPVEIIIPSIQTDLTIDPGTIQNGVWQISDTKATFLDTSATPGSAGNTIIYGHNKKAIFGNLPYLSVGQKISVKTKSGTIYKYIVTDKYFVNPNRVDLVSPTMVKELTIFTCWGLFDNQRVVIKAKPV